MPQSNFTFDLARWAQTLVGIAQNGLTFSNSPFDVERYHELLKLAAEMTAAINANAQPDPTLAAELNLLWRQQVVTQAKGYITPKISTGAVVFNEQDELLLVYHALRHYWVCPGGNIDVGYTATATVRKEVREETGLLVTPLALIAVNDCLHQGYVYPWHTYALMFYCRLDGGELAPQTKEIAEARFFAREALPTLLLDGKPSWVQQAFAWHYGHTRLLHFD